MFSACATKAINSYIASAIVKDSRFLDLDYDNLKSKNMCLPIENLNELLVPVVLSHVQLNV